MSRRELFATLCGMSFLANLSQILFAPLLQPVATDFAVTAAALGVVTSAVWLGSAVSRLLAGAVLTRLSRQAVVLVTGSTLVCSAALTGFAVSVPHLTAGAFLMGLSAGAYYIAANPLLSELFPDRAGSVLGLHGLASQVASVAAPLLLSGVLLVGGWRLTLFCVAGVATVTTTSTLWAVRRNTLPDAGIEDRSLRVAGLAQWRTILTGVVILGAAGFLWNALFNLYGSYLTATRGIDPETGRLLLSVMFAAGLPAFVVTGWLADRVPNVPLMIVSLCVFTLAVFGLTMTGSLAVLVVLSTVIGYTFHALYPASDTYLLVSVPARHRASAYALFSGPMMSIQALGSGTVGTAVARGVGYTVAFQSVAAVVGLVTAVLGCCYRAGWLPTGDRSA